jgi:hypothetical protein
MFCITLTNCFICSTLDTVNLQNMRVSGPTDDSKIDSISLQDDEAIQIDLEDRNDTEAPIDMMRAMSSCPTTTTLPIVDLPALTTGDAEGANLAPVPESSGPTTTTLPIVDLPVLATGDAEGGNLAPVPESSSAPLSVSFDTAQGLLPSALERELVPGCSVADVAIRQGTDGKTTINHVAERIAQSFVAGGSGKGKKGKGEHKKRTNPKSITPEFVISYILCNEL